MVGRIKANYIVILLVIVASSAVVGYYATTRLRSGGGQIVWVQTSNPSRSFDIAYATAIDNTAIYVAGYDYSKNTYGEPSWRIEKRNLLDGTLVWTQATPNTSAGRIYDVAVGPSGIYLVGTTPQIPPPNGYYYDQEWIVEKRSLAGGALIWNQTTRIVTPGGAQANAVTADSTGIYVAGMIVDSTGASLWRVEKRELTSGAIIWVEPGPSVVGAACSIAVDSSGVYVLGYEGRWSYSDYSSWRIEKISTTNGNLFWKTQMKTSTSSGNPAGIAVDATGLYIVGSDKGFRTEKRSLTDGILQWVQTENIATAVSSFDNQDHARDVAADSSGVYIVGMDTIQGSNNNCEWRIEKRTAGQEAPH